MTIDGLAPVTGTDNVTMDGDLSSVASTWYSDEEEDKNVVVEGYDYTPIWTRHKWFPLHYNTPFDRYWLELSLHRPDLSHRRPFVPDVVRPHATPAPGPTHAPKIDMVREAEVPAAWPQQEKHLLLNSSHALHPPSSSTHPVVDVINHSHNSLPQQLHVAAPIMDNTPHHYNTASGLSLALGSSQSPPNAIITPAAPSTSFHQGTTAPTTTPAPAFMRKSSLRRQQLKPVTTTSRRAPPVKDLKSLIYHTSRGIDVPSSLPMEESRRRGSSANNADEYYLPEDQAAAGSSRRRRVRVDLSTSDADEDMGASTYNKYSTPQKRLRFDATVKTVADAPRSTSPPPKPVIIPANALGLVVPAQTATGDDTTSATAPDGAGDSGKRLSVLTDITTLSKDLVLDTDVAPLELDGLVFQTRTKFASLKVGPPTPPLSHNRRLRGVGAENNTNHTKRSSGNPYSRTSRERHRHFGLRASEDDLLADSNMANSRPRLMDHKSSSPEANGLGLLLGDKAPDAPKKSRPHAGVPHYVNDTTLPEGSRLVDWRSMVPLLYPPSPTNKITPSAFMANWLAAQETCSLQSWLQMIPPNSGPETEAATITPPRRLDRLSNTARMLLQEHSNMTRLVNYLREKHSGARPSPPAAPRKAPRLRNAAREAMHSHPHRPSYTAPTPYARPSQRPFEAPTGVTTTTTKKTKVGKKKVNLTIVVPPPPPPTTVVANTEAGALDLTDLSDALKEVDKATLATARARVKAYFEAARARETTVEC